MGGPGTAPGGARDHNDVVVGGAQPQLAVLRVRGDRLLDDGSSDRASARRHSSVIGDFKPYEYTVSDRTTVRMHEIGMMLLIPSVKLKDQFTADVDPSVNVVMIAWRAPGRLRAAKNSRIPPSRCTDIADC